jgi:hypothetical protein
LSGFPEFCLVLLLIPAVSCCVLLLLLVCVCLCFCLGPETVVPNRIEDMGDRAVMQPHRPGAVGGSTPPRFKEY